MATIDKNITVSLGDLHSQRDLIAYWFYSLPDIQADKTDYWTNLLNKIRKAKSNADVLCLIFPFYMDMKGDGFRCPQLEYGLKFETIAEYIIWLLGKYMARSDDKPAGVVMHFWIDFISGKGGLPVDGNEDKSMPEDLRSYFYLMDYIESGKQAYLKTWDKPELKEVGNEYSEFQARLQDRYNHEVFSFLHSIMMTE